MVDPVLNILHIFVRLGHTNIAELINHLFLRVLATVPNSIVDAVYLLSKCLFCFFAIDLRQLLEFELVLAHQVLLFLC